MVLLVTLVLLVVLSWVGYRISSRVAALRHHSQYMIDYQKARYGRDSALKYALATLEDVNAVLVSRPNEPDFSDIFALSEPEYDLLLQQWAEQLAAEAQASGWTEQTSWPGSLPEDNDFFYLEQFEGTAAFGEDMNDPNLAYDETAGPNDLDLAIRGPYGPPWPQVSEPVEFKVGQVDVTMSIEDENAKYPACWATLTEGPSARLAEKSLAVFCEWMGITGEEFDYLQLQFDEVADLKSFTLPAGSSNDKDAAARAAAKVRSSRTRRTVRRIRRPAAATTAAADSKRDFAKLFHSPLVDTELFARPTVESSTRKESALKYMGLWGSDKVNFNTAPRHVLEAALVFGGDEVEIADAIIQQRRGRPFNDITDLKKSLLRYSGSIERCEKFLTAKSEFFTVRITAESGRAKASAVMAMVRNEQKVEKIAVIAD